MMARRLAAERGVTLLEVLIALSILAMVLLPVVLGFSQALTNTARSTIQSVATSWAREKMEELKLLPYDQVVSTTTRLSRDLKPGDSFYQLEVLVQELRANTPNPPPTMPHQTGLKQVTINVYRRGSATPTATMMGYLAPSGV